jgi:hypothetical protein
MIRVLGDWVYIQYCTPNTPLSEASAKMLDLVASRQNDRAAPDGLMSGRHSAAAETDLTDFDTTH